jgi:peptide methionine sulfoxide reductase msrA/msrB
MNWAVLLGILGGGFMGVSDVQAEVKESTATFAGGCFWCMQSPFDELPGVLRTAVGYTGGHTPHPTYEDVSSGATGHWEAIQIIYNPSLVSYAQLLDTFWRSFDPTDDGGQFGDRGPQYRPALFYHSEEQKKLAEMSRKALGDSGRFNRPIRTAILPAAPFTAAEDYHQCYYKKNPAHYKAYKVGSGRAGFLEKVWKKK